MIQKKNLVEGVKTLMEDKKDPVDSQTREFSHGRKGGDSFISEERGQDTVSIEIENTLLTDRTINVGALFNHQFKNVADLAAAVGADLAMDDGILETTAPAENLTVTRNDSGRTANEFLRYISKNPTRITALSFESAKVSTGAPDTSNYTATIKTSWVSPFQTPTEHDLPLRKFQSNRANSPQFADINFIDEGFTTLLSPEHNLIVTVKKDTVLNLTFSIGAQDSRSQRMYRAVKKADLSLMPVRRAARRV